MQICADLFLVVRMSGCPCRLFVDRTSYDTPAGRLDEIEDQIPFLARLVLGLDRFQRLRISKHVMVQGGSRIGKDIPPYTLIGRDPIVYCGINIVGLRRRGFTNQQVFLIQDIYLTHSRSVVLSPISAVVVSPANFMS